MSTYDVPVARLLMLVKPSPKVRVTAPPGQTYAVNTLSKGSLFMSVTVTLLFPTKAEVSDAFFETLSAALPETRAFDGCIGVTTHRDLDDPSKVLLIEEWETREHQLAYLKWRAETGLLDAIGPMLAGEPVISAYSNTGG